MDAQITIYIIHEQYSSWNPPTLQTVLQYLDTIGEEAFNILVKKSSSKYGASWTVILFRHSFLYTLHYIIAGEKRGVTIHESK